MKEKKMKDLLVSTNLMHFKGREGHREVKHPAEEEVPKMGKL